MEENDEQAGAWEHFYERVGDVCKTLGTEDTFGRGDYLIVDDNYGWRETHIEIHNLRMLAPEIVARLRALLPQENTWQISVAVHVPGTKPLWPVMGLTIRSHEIIDGLQRHNCPEPYRSYRYDGSRPGTEMD